MDDILNSLNKEQKEAVIHSGSPLLILAGAGTGKTRVITTKIAYLIDQGVDPQSILAVTFTKKAANEMRERACLLNPLAAKAQICTFHSFGARFLRYYGQWDGLSSDFIIYDDDDSVNLLRKTYPNLAKVEAKEFFFKISRAKDFALSPDDDLSPIDDSPEFAAIYAEYEKALVKTGNVDFGDLILRPIQILRNFPEVQRRISGRFSTIMVDEYQDSNVAQFQLLQALNSPGTYLCVVGDDDQSIYKFRGAEIQNILSFQAQFKGSALIRLTINYRSLAPILDVANQSIQNNMGRLGKTLTPFRGDGEPHSIMEFLTAEDEAQGLCNLISQSIKKGNSYSDWAILYRTNAQSRIFETELSRNKIPYKIFGNSGFFEREEVKDGLAYISVFLNPRDSVNFARIINKPARKLGEKTVEKITTFADAEGCDYFSAGKKVLSSLGKDAQKGLKDFFRIFEEAGKKIDMSVREKGGQPDLFSEEGAQKGEAQDHLSDFVNSLFEISGLKELYKKKDEINGTDRGFNLTEILHMAEKYPATYAGLMEFLDNTNLDNTMDKTASPDNAVTLSTLHNTKGLEFGRVVITGLESGLFPREDKTTDELEEERRLFYVGITRAKDKVIFTFCRQRQSYTDRNQWYGYNSNPWREPSIFLKELMKNNNSKENETGFEKSHFGKASMSFNSEAAAMIKEWPIGQGIFCDDYGYGWITKHLQSEEGLIATVSFENGIQKKFPLPKESQKLMKISQWD